MLLVSENIGIAAKMSLLSCIQAGNTIFHMHFRLQAAIYNVLLIPILSSILICPVMLLDPENIGIADGIVLLSCLQAEIYVIPCPCTSGYI